MLSCRSEDCCRSGLTDCCREGALCGEGWGACLGVGGWVVCCLGHPHIPQYIRSGGRGEGCVCVIYMCMYVCVCVGVVSVAVGLVGVLGWLLGGSGVSHAALGQ